MTKGMRLLSKSDFKLARTCGTKLNYKEMGYPSLTEDDPYLEFLADGGFMVEAMAKLLFPNGLEIGHWDRTDLAFEETRRALGGGDCVLFEPTAVHGLTMARVDILERRRNELRLIEVKAKSVDTSKGGTLFRGAQGGISSDWRPYLEDVAFQVLVLSRAFPGYRISPELCLVDKARGATENSTFDKFHLVRGPGRHGLERPEVTYLGNLGRLQSEHVLAFVAVTSEVEEILPEVKAAADSFAATLSSSPIVRIAPEIGQKCKGCEYRINVRGEGPSGFRDCWGELADPEPHVLDLYRVDLLGGRGEDVVARMASSGHARLEDVPADAIQGKVAERQETQIRCTAEGREYISPELPGPLLSHPYPHHFVDFEASPCALPYHPGMRPYEKAVFQWSCHTVRAPGAPLEHDEWLNDREGFPNFAFARALRERIGEGGTVYVWSHYERTTLREIRAQMDKYGEDDEGLAAWLDRMGDRDNPRLVDLCEVAKQHYFHPRMKGSLSIKYVLPAVWESDAALRESPDFRRYARTEEGRVLDPYEALPPLTIAGSEVVVAEGTGAMQAYQEMMFGESAGDPARREAYRRLLLQYCELDTAAMVMIWKHWAGNQ